MSDLTSLEQRFRAANPVPDPSDPPMAAASAAAALLEFEARSVDMQTEERPAQLEPQRRHKVSRIVIGAAAAAVTVILIVLFASGILGGDEEVIEPNAELYCQLDAQLDLLPPSEYDSTTARQVRNDLAAIVAAAPLEIRDNVEADINQWLAMLSLWEEADWDESRLDKPAMDAAFNAWFGWEAGDLRVEDWQDQNCPDEPDES